MLAQCNTILSSSFKKEDKLLIYITYGNLCYQKIDTNDNILYDHAYCMNVDTVWLQEKVKLMLKNSEYCLLQSCKLETGKSMMELYTMQEMFYILTGVEVT